MPRKYGKRKEKDDKERKLNALRNEVVLSDFSLVVSSSCCVFCVWLVRKI